MTYRIGRRLSGPELKKFRSEIARLKKTGPESVRKQLANVNARRARPMQMRGGQHLYEIVRERSKPVTLKEFGSLDTKSRNANERAAAALTDLRAGKSLKQSLADNKTTLRNVKKYAGGSLVKDANGKYRASKTDPLIREMEAPFANGSRAIPIRGSRDASLLGQYWQAVREFRYSGDTSRLAKFRGKSIRSGENKIEFITDPTELRDLLDTGLLDFESIYKPK